MAINKRNCFTYNTNSSEWLDTLRHITLYTNFSNDIWSNSNDSNIPTRAKKSARATRNK